MFRCNTSRLGMQETKEDGSEQIQPATDISFFFTEFYTEFYYFASVRLIRYQVTFIINLLQGLFCRAVQFELEDVNVFRGLHYGVRTAFSTFHFRLRELAHQLEDKVEHYLIVTFGLCVQFVGEVGKEGLQAGEEGVVIACTQFLHKLTDIKSLVAVRHRSVVWYQKVDKTIADFVVGELQQVIAKLLVVVLNGEITTLVNQRDRITGIHAILREHGSRSFNAIEQGTQIVFRF